MLFGLAIVGGAAPPQQAAGGSAINLPDEFTAELNLETAIDSKSAVGMPITATLRKDIKTEKTTVVPKGAKLEGQLTKMDNQGGTYTLDIAFTSIDSKAGHADLSQRKNEVQILVSSRNQMITPVPGLQGQQQPAEAVNDTPSPLVFKTKHLKVQRGSHLILRSSK